MKWLSTLLFLLVSTTAIVARAEIRVEEDRYTVEYDWKEIKFKGKKADLDAKVLEYASLTETYDSLTVDRPKLTADERKTLDLTHQRMKQLQGELLELVKKDAMGAPKAGTIKTPFIYSESPNKHITFEYYRNPKDNEHFYEIRIEYAASGGMLATVTIEESVVKINRN